MCWCYSALFSVNSFMNHAIDMQWIVFVAPVVVLLQDRNRKRKEASNNETFLSFLSCHSIIVLLGVCVRASGWISVFPVCACVVVHIVKSVESIRRTREVLATLFDVVIDETMIARKDHTKHTDLIFVCFLSHWFSFFSFSSLFCGYLLENRQISKNKTNQDLTFQSFEWPPRSSIVPQRSGSVQSKPGSSNVIAEWDDTHSRRRTILNVVCDSAKEPSWIDIYFLWLRKTYRSTLIEYEKKTRREKRQAMSWVRRMTVSVSLGKWRNRCCEHDSIHCNNTIWQKYETEEAGEEDFYKNKDWLFTESRTRERTFFFFLSTWMRLKTT